MSAQILFKRGAAADWTTANPILGNGEPGFETDTGKLKIGNGTTTWNLLGYVQNTNSDSNATYTVSAESAADGADIRLTRSDNVVDFVRLVSGNNITITRTNNDTITISSTSATPITSIDDIPGVSLTSPAAGQVLKYNGSNWVNATDATASGGTGGLSVRTEISGTSTTLANNISGLVLLNGYSAYALLKIQTSAASWVRIYVSDNARISDSGRSKGTDPLPGSGVIAEVITNGPETVLISPGTIGFNNDAPVTTTIPVAVTNLSGADAAITVTLTAVQLEA